MDIKKTCSEILTHVGGEGNIDYVFHCATRLRFNLKDESKINIEQLEKVDGVLGTASKSGQFQVIMGPSVDKFYKEFIQLGDFEKKEHEKKEKITVKSIFMAIVDAIAGSFNPILPAVIGCAMLKVVLLLLNMIGILPETSQTYMVLSYADDAAFYFMPFLLAASAAKKFNCNTYLALTIAGFLFYPNFITAVNEGQQLSFFGLPLGMVSYASTVFPIISIIWIQSLLEKVLDKYIPDVIKYLTKPLILLFIMIPVSLCVLGPVTSYLSTLLAEAFAFISQQIGWLFSVLLAIALPFLVPVGMHSGIVPLILNNLSNQGFDATFFASYLAFHFALAGSGLAVFFKVKNKEMKNVSFMGSLTTLLGGITEPLLFGVHLKLKKPLIGTVIGGAIAGAYAGIVKLTAYVFAFPCITSVLMWKEPSGISNIMNAVITMVIGLIAGFVATWILGFEEENNDEEDEEKEDTKEMYAPTAGKVIALEDLKDEAFSQKQLGDGVAIQPTDNKVYAPCSGTLEVIFPTKHAYVIKTDDDLEVLIHIGIDTVQLQGEGFKTSLKQGVRVKRGDLLCQFDNNKIKEANLQNDVIITIMNKKNCMVDKQVGREVTYYDVVYKIEKEMEN